MYFNRSDFGSFGFECKYLEFSSQTSVRHIPGYLVPVGFGFSVFLRVSRVR